MQITPQEQKIIRSNYLFSELNEDALNGVVSHAMRRELQAGEMLFTEGTTLNQFYLVAAGVIKLFRLSPAGEEKVIELIGPRQLFAEAIMFLGGRYPVHAQALETATVIGFDGRQFTGLLHDNQQLCFRLMSSMSRRIHGLVNEIDRLTLHSGTERMIQYLLDQLPQEAEAAPSVRLTVPKQVIASRIGVQPETLSRILSKLRHDGLIEVTQETIVLRDIEALRRLT